MQVAQHCRKGAEPADVVMSDMKRYGNATAGVELLRRVQEAPEQLIVIYCVGSLDRERGTPVGEFGITNRPDDLIHLVLDV